MRGTGKALAKDRGMTRILWTVAGLFTIAALALPGEAVAQQGGECSGGFCGTPRQVGGGGCGCGGGSILINNTDMGDTYSTSDDFDNDGYEDDFDNCPFIQNRDQLDGDGDSVGDGCDNAPALPNPDQLDIDGDGIGDVADDDLDGDNIPNASDNCQRVYNPTQRKTMDSAQLGDACNPDDDLDGVSDAEDRCPKVPGDTAIGGRACDDDEDLDGIPDARDNCPSISNDEQGDINGDGLGDRCDFDMDGDSVPNNLDNAPTIPNPDQLDRDRDGIGDADPSDEFCYVFDRARADSCLNPLDTFKVGALPVHPGSEVPEVGEEIALALFANRVDAPIEYTWSVVSAPDGSDATVRASAGKAVQSKPESDGFEYAYALDGNNVAPTFVPDRAGTYELKLVAKLMFDDEAFPGGPTVATYSMKLTAGGDAASSGGCTTASGQATGASLLLVGLGMLWMRRRRS